MDSNDIRDIIVFVVLIFLLLFLFYFTKLNSLLFKPTKSIQPYEETPFEETEVNGISVARFIFNPDSKTVLFCHGNSGNLTNRTYMIKLAKISGLNLILFDYHGYGKSQGIPSTRRLLKNGKTVLNWTLDRVKEDELIIWGESLGGSVASYLASKCNCHKLVLFATFSSLENLALGIDEDKWYMKPLRQMFSFIFHPLPTRKWVSKTKCPVLIVHSIGDTLIDIKHARYTHSIDKGRIKLMEIRGDHGSPIVTENQIDEIFNFCDIYGNLQLDICVKIFDEVRNEVWVN